MKKLHVIIAVAVVLVAASVSVGILGCDSTGAGPAGGTDPVDLEIDLTGHWIMTLPDPGSGDGEIRVLFYLIHTDDPDSNLNGLMLTGHVSGASVTFTISTVDGDVEVSGTIQPNGTITGTVDFGGGSPAGMQMTRFHPTSGSLELNGLIDLALTDRGLAGKSSDYIVFYLGFEFHTSLIDGFVTFETVGELTVGTYEVVDEYCCLECGTDDESVAAWAYGYGWDLAAVYGELDVSTYDPDAEVTGTFWLEFEDGDHLSGWFELEQPVESGGTVFIESGELDGVVVSDEEGTGLPWSTGTELVYGSFSIVYLDEDIAIGVEFMPQVEIGVGTYSVPDEMDVFVIYVDYSGGLHHGEYEDPESGTVTISAYDPTLGIEGTFEVEFNGGTLTGEFDVVFEICEFEFYW